MRRSRLSRLALALLAVTAATIGLATRAPAAVARVAIVKSSGLGPFAEAAAALEKALRSSARQPEVLTFDLGGDAAKATEVFRQVAAARPSLVVAVGSLATRLALEAGVSAPLMFAMVLYPQESGFLEHPAQLATGASLDIPLATQFKYLRRIVPQAKRVGVLYNPEESRGVVAAARREAAAQGLTLVERVVEQASDAVAVLDGLLPEVDAVWAVADSQVFTPQTTPAIILAALRGRVPLLGLSAAQVRAGALAALVCDYADIGRQAAEIAGRILDGADPATIPVTHPRAVALVLNARTADHLKLSLAADVLAEAKEVMQ